MRVKSQFFITLLVGTGMVFLACGVNSPANTVRKFYGYMEAGDAEKVIGLFSQDVINALGKDKLQTAVEMNIAKIKSSGGIKSLKLENETINGNLAQVSVTTVSGNGETSTETVKLVKENGVWKFALSK